GHSEITITATPRMGDVNLYVLRCDGEGDDEHACNTTPSGDGGSDGDGELELPTAQHFDWAATASASLSGRSVTFDRVDEKTTAYLVGVEGASRGVGNHISHAHYALTTKDTATIMTLVPNKSVRDRATSGGYSYFKFKINKPQAAFSVSVTPETGDPDLFMSTNVTNPSIANYTWSSLGYGGDSLSLAPENEGYCDQCVYYVAVYGSRTDTTFTLLVNEGSDVGTVLRDGVSLNSYVGILSTNYYEFYYDGSTEEELSITVMPLYGDPDIYTTVDGTRPSKENSQFNSKGWWQSIDSVILRPTDPTFKQYCSVSCTVRIAVYGFIMSEYSITANTEEVAMLLSRNNAFQGMVARGKYEHFLVP
ncbi:unnamed protein product, partial [Chrysoparadoxa australica]